MKREINYKLVKALKGFFQLGYGIAWLFLIIMIIVLLVSFFNEEFRAFLSRVPINFSLKDNMIDLKIGETLQQARLERASGMLILEKGNDILSFMNIGWYLFFSVFMILVSRMILKFIRNVEKAEIFTFENVKLIRWIALIHIIAFFINLCLSIASSVFLSNALASETIVHLGMLGPATEPSLLVFPVLVLIFAELFKMGLKIREENELTI